MVVRGFRRPSGNGKSAGVRRTQSAQSLGGRAFLTEVVGQALRGGGGHTQAGVGEGWGVEVLRLWPGEGWQGVGVGIGLFPFSVL